MTRLRKTLRSTCVTFFVSGSSRYIHLRPSTAASPNSRGGGFSNARMAFPSGRVRNGLPEPPTAAEPIPDQRHGSQCRVGIVPQPHLDLQHLHIHAADSAWHSSLAFPPADTFEPSDRCCADGPLPAPADHRCGVSACSCLEHHMFHTRTL